MEPLLAITPASDALVARLAELEGLVAAQAQEIMHLTALVAQLQAQLAAQEAELQQLQGRPPSDKNARNSSVPPSQSPKPARPLPPPAAKQRGARFGHPGISRRRSPPDFVAEDRPAHCGACGHSLAGVAGHVIGRSQQLELPPLRPLVLERVRYRCVCPGCGVATAGSYPEGWDPRQRFGPRFQLTVAYLQHRHHLGWERLREALRDLWGIRVSEGTLGNCLARTAAALTPAYEAIRALVGMSRVVGSDEAPQRVNGHNAWEWVVQSAAAAYHWIARSRAAQQLVNFYGGLLPEVQESDCFSAQLASPVPGKQVCHAHQLRDLLYAQEHGDRDYAPKMARLIRIAIHLDHRRAALPASLFAHQAARLKRLGQQLGWQPLVANPFGEAMQCRYRRLEPAWWVFLDRADVNPTNNASERALRPSVVHRKMHGCFQTEWGAAAYAQFISVVQTAQKQGLGIFETLLESVAPHAASLFAPQPDG